MPLQEPEPKAGLGTVKQMSRSKQDQKLKTRLRTRMPERDMKY